MSYNKVILIGNVGKEPEVKYFDSENCLATFTLATNERGYTRASGEEVSGSTDWHNIKTFHRTAKFVEQYVRTGSYLLVEGRIHYREYVDKQGHNHRVTEIVADRVEFAGRERGTETSPAESAVREIPQEQAEQPYKRFTDALIGDETLPF